MLSQHDPEAGLLSAVEKIATRAVGCMQWVLLYELHCSPIILKDVTDWEENVMWQRQVESEHSCCEAQVMKKHQQMMQRGMHKEVLYSKQ